MFALVREGEQGERVALALALHAGELKTYFLHRPQKFTPIWSRNNLVQLSMALLSSERFVQKVNTIFLKKGEGKREVDPT